MNAKILVGVPCGNVLVHSLVLTDIFEAVKNFDATMCFMYGYQVDVTRNKICEKVLDEGYSHVLFVDSDVRLPEDALANLISCDEDIVFGYYSHRGQTSWDGKTSSLVKPNQIGYKDLYDSAELSRLYGRGVNKIEIKAGGMGCSLISSHALSTIEKPWFHYRDTRKGDLSEDYWFCKEASKAGFRIFADLRVECLHGTYVWEHVGGKIDGI